MTVRPEVVGIIGGTGKLGSALAARWAQAGLEVIIGSRSADKARMLAGEMVAREGIAVEGASNIEAAARASLVVVTVPWSAQETTLAEIRAAVQGKVVVDTTVPLALSDVTRAQLPPEGSAAARAQRLLGRSVHVVSAFHTVAAHLLSGNAPLECDVLVFGDRVQDCERVLALVRAAGLSALHGGPLANSAAAEALTSVLIFIDRDRAAEGTGIRVTGLKRPFPTEAGATPEGTDQQARDSGGGFE